MAGRQETLAGRERQKNRTRRELIAAAAELVRSGATPSVADVAAAAEVSRATAYRYFPTQELLLAEVALFAAGGPLFEPGDTDGLSTAEAVGRLARRVGEWAYDNEQALRVFLRLSLDPATGVRRPAHRVGWIADVLAPVRGQLDRQAYARLSAGLTLLLGIDPIVALTDIARVSRARGLDTLEWSARVMFEAALRGTVRT